MIDFISGDLGAFGPGYPYPAGQGRCTSHCDPRARDVLTGTGHRPGLHPPEYPRRLHGRRRALPPAGRWRACSSSRPHSNATSPASSRTPLVGATPTSTSPSFWPARLDRQTINGEGYHNISHGGGGDTHDQAQFAIDKYFCSVVAGLLVEMKMPSRNSMAARCSTTRSSSSGTSAASAPPTTCAGHADASFRRQVPQDERRPLLRLQHPSRQAAT